MIWDALYFLWISMLLKNHSPPPLFFIFSKRERNEKDFNLRVLSIEGKMVLKINE